METFLKYYKNTAIFMVLAVIAGGVIGWFQGHAIASVITAALTVMILSVLETSLSFDNAVLNATVLKRLPYVNRKWFMTWGVLIAVLGMRLITPILIVSAIDAISPYSAFVMALTDPKTYSTVLASSGVYVSAFGGAFLLMVAFSFFLDSEKDEHWLTWLEKPLTKLGTTTARYLTVVLAILAISFTVPDVNHVGYFVAAAAGAALYLAIDWVKDYLEGDSDKIGSVNATAINAAKTGGLITASIASLVYLEILDASMSFDGVIGAFAVTTQIFLVMLGLGVGASFVRSMTIQLVDTDKMSEFRFLEHGAQWAILTLALLMFYKISHTVPEIVSGLSGAFFIGAAVYHSQHLNKKEAAALPRTVTVP